MSNSTTITPAKASMQFGILFGLIMVLEFVAMYVIDIDPVTNPSIGIIMNLFNYLIIPVVFIGLACKNYKNANGGYITFGECLKIGVLLCVVAAAISGLFTVIFNLIFPEYMEEVLRKTRDAMMVQNPDMPEDQMEMALSMTEKFMNPYILVPITILMFAFFGLIYSLIIGAIVKKDRPQTF